MRGDFTDKNYLTIIEELNPENIDEDKVAAEIAMALYRKCAKRYNKINEQVSIPASVAVSNNKEKPEQPTKNNEELRECKRCGIKKPLSEFYSRDENGKRRYDGSCKKCVLLSRIDKEKNKSKKEAKKATKTHNVAKKSPQTQSILMGHFKRFINEGYFDTPHLKNEAIAKVKSYGFTEFSDTVAGTYLGRLCDAGLLDRIPTGKGNELKYIKRGLSQESKQSQGATQAIKVDEAQLKLQ